MVVEKVFDSGLKLSMSFDKKVYIFSDNSSTGKTYLFKVLRRYCKEKGITYSVINYLDIDRVDFNDDYVVEQCKMYELVALDNADLYMNPKLFKRINNLGNTILVSLKDDYLALPFHIDDNFNYNYVEADLFFVNNKLEVL